MFFQVAAISDLGCVREKNEDNFICNQYVKDMLENYCFVTKKMECSDLRPRVYGVFDGMGGYNKGELSSYSVALNAKKMIKEIERKNIEEIIKQFYMESNKEICDYMAKYNIRTGTTVALVCIYKKILFILIWEIARFLDYVMEDWKRCMKSIQRESYLNF